MLHEPSKARILGGEGSMSERVLQTFEDLVKDAEDMDCPCLDLVVTFIDKDDEFVPGTYVPELHLIVRKVDEE